MISKRYDVYFKKHKKLVSVFSRDYKKEVPHIYCLIINKTINRNYLRNELLKNKIETGVHYKPGYYLDYYKSNKKNFPNCEKIQKKIITLPLHPGITNNHINAYDYGYEFFLIALKSIEAQFKFQSVSLINAISLMFSDKKECEKFINDII